DERRLDLDPCVRRPLGPLLGRLAGGGTPLNPAYSTFRPCAVQTAAERRPRPSAVDVGVPWRPRRPARRRGDSARRSPKYWLPRVSALRGRRPDRTRTTPRAG